jgi:hypothetical protein
MTVNEKYQELYRLQDKLLEHKVERFTGKFAVSIGYFIERAGDVYRELFKHGGEFIDFGYIESKMKPLRTEFYRPQDKIMNLREVLNGRREHPEIAAAYDAYAIMYIYDVKRLQNKTRKQVKERHLLRAGIAALDVITALTLWGMARYDPDKVYAKIKKLDIRLNQLIKFNPR